MDCGVPENRLRGRILKESSPGPWRVFLMFMPKCRLNPVLPRPPLNFRDQPAQILHGSIAVLPEGGRGLELPIEAFRQRRHRLVWRHKLHKTFRRAQPAIPGSIHDRHGM